MAKMQPAASPAAEDTAVEDMNRLLFDAPIAELAQSQGISIDDAVKLRVEKSIEAAPLPLDVSVRLIEPQGNLKGFASVKIGGLTMDDFKIMDGKNGLFLASPSREAPGTRSGYRRTVQITDRALQERLDSLARDAYGQAVDKLLARADAVRPAPIKEQMAQAAKEADKANAARNAPAKAVEGRDDR